MPIPSFQTASAANHHPTRRARVRLTIEDGLARIVVGGVFDVGVAAAVRAEFHELGALADAVLLDLRAVTRLETGFDLSAFVDEIERHCWISGCRLRLTATHPALVPSRSTARE